MDELILLLGRREYELSCEPRAHPREPFVIHARTLSAADPARICRLKTGELGLADSSLGCLCPDDEPADRALAAADALDLAGVAEVFADPSQRTVATHCHRLRFGVDRGPEPLDPLRTFYSAYVAATLPPSWATRVIWERLGREPSRAERWVQDDHSINHPAMRDERERRQTARAPGPGQAAARAAGLL